MICCLVNTHPGRFARNRRIRNSVAVSSTGLFLMITWCLPGWMVRSLMRIVASSSSASRPRRSTARSRAALRPGLEAEDDEATIRIKDLTIHPGRHQVIIKNKPVELTATEFRILLFLAKRPGWVFTRQQIIDAAQGDDVFVTDRFVTDRSVDVHIVSLRRKLGCGGAYIETVRGVGYRLQDD